MLAQPFGVWFSGKREVISSAIVLRHFKILRGVGRFIAESRLVAFGVIQRSSCKSRCIGVPKFKAVVVACG